MSIGKGEKFTDELFRHVPPHEVLSELLGVEVSPVGETRMACPRPSRHRRNDWHMSATANGEKGLFKCHGCGLSGDVVQLAIEFGPADNVADAIRWLRKTYGLPARGSRCGPPPGRAGASSVGQVKP